MLTFVAKYRSRRLWELFESALTRKGLTRKDVADATGVSLYNLDRGRVPREWAAVRRAGEFLGLDSKKLYWRWWLARRLKWSRKPSVPVRAAPVSEREWKELVDRARVLYRDGLGVREIVKRARREGWLERLRVALPREESDAHRVTLAVFGVRSVDGLRCPVCGFVPKVETLYNYYLRPRRLGDAPWKEWKCRRCKGKTRPVFRFEAWLKLLLPKRKPLKALCGLLRQELGIEAHYLSPSAIIVKGKQISVSWPDLNAGKGSISWKEVLNPKFWGVEECEVPRVIRKVYDLARSKGLG